MHVVFVVNIYIPDNREEGKRQLQKQLNGGRSLRYCMHKPGHAHQKEVMTQISHCREPGVGRHVRLRRQGQIVSEK
jgi:hypothetical protein